MNIILIQIQNSKSFKPDCHASRDTCGTDNARYDSRVGAHGHFICEKGGRIPDFDWPEGAVIPPEMLSRGVSHMEIRLVGICRRCAAATGGSAPSQANDFPNNQPK